MTFVFAGKRCRETLPLAPTAANIKATERLMSRVFQEIELGVFDYETTFPHSKRATTGNGFTSYAEYWLTTIVAEKSTMQGYESAVRKLWGLIFGERQLASIKASEIKREIAKLAKRVTGKTVNNNLIPLRAIFEMAIDDRLIERTPMERISSLSHQQPVPDPFDRDDMEQIIDFMCRRYDPQIWNWYEFAFGTGMRPSEQIALQWRDVDWKRRTVRVQRARVRHVEKGTKTSSIRDVDMTDRMMDVLQRQKLYSFMRGAESPIFINPVTNTPWPDVQDQRKLYFHPALRALGIRSRDAYQTRHTYATTALMAGVNPAYIARQLGHKNPTMLFKHYGKWIDGADGGAEAAKLNALYKPRKPGAASG
ncbi:tyrosine-type recombinase/integrase [Sphingomonas carotinifaciens]|uniref:tyrosine-type recombinase/integrase n=1 Tax=Sphingomonas carotinifaciens TaxID=1166323 RepID=UPI0039A0BBF4